MRERARSGFSQAVPTSAPARRAKVIAMTTTATPEDKRARAHQARRARTARIMALRRRVVATALATFALATGVVAWAGSMGAAAPPASGSTAASGSVLVEGSVQSDAAAGRGDAGALSSDASSSDDVVTTQQS